MRISPRILAAALLPVAAFVAPLPASAQPSDDPCSPPPLCKPDPQRITDYLRVRVTGPNGTATAWRTPVSVSTAPPQASVPVTYTAYDPEGSTAAVRLVGDYSYQCQFDDYSVGPVQTTHIETEWQAAPQTLRLDLAQPPTTCSLVIHASAVLHAENPDGTSSPTATASIFEWE